MLKSYDYHNDLDLLMICICACLCLLLGLVFSSHKGSIKKWKSKRHSLTVKTCFAHSLSFILCIVVEVTMNLARYGSRRSQQPENVNFEPNIRGLKSDKDA